MFEVSGVSWDSGRLAKVYEDMMGLGSEGHFRVLTLANLSVDDQGGREGRVVGL